MLMKAPVSQKTAVSRARRGKCGLGGLCLAFSRGVYSIPAKWLSADLAWRNATYRVVQSTTRNMPVGAFIHMWAAFSKYQHIAIYLGNGLMATTDSNRKCTYVGTVSSWQRAGYKIRGWAADCNGYVVPELKKVYDRIKGKKGSSPTPRPKAGARQRLRLNANAVRRLQTVLGTKVDGKIDPEDSLVVRALQKKAGVAEDGYFSKPSVLGKKIQRYLNSLKNKKTGKPYFNLAVDGLIDGPKTTAALEYYLLTLHGKFTNLHKI